MNRVLKIAILPLVALAGACNNEKDMPGTIDRTPLSVPARVGAFAEGDNIGLYMTTSSVQGTKGLAGERYCDNVKFTLVGSSFLSNPQTFFPKDENSYNNIYVYAPYIDGFIAPGKTTGEISLPEDQSVNQVMDLRYATVMDFKPTDGQPKFEMEHAFSKVNIRLTPGGYYDNLEEIPAKRKIVIKGVCLSGAFDLENQNFICDSKKSVVIPSGRFKATGSYLSGVSFIMPAQTIPADEVFIEVVAGDDVFILKPSQPLEFAAGTESTITIKLNADFAGVILNTDIVVDKWTPGEDIDMDRDEILPPEEKTVKDFDGNEYPVVRIGKQFWMAANLRTSHLNDGNSIHKNEDKSEWIKNIDEAAYSAYNDDFTAETIEKMGYLYNRNAVESNRLCPEGWHIPTATDWDALGKALGGESTAVGSWKGIGFSMMSTEGWNKKNGTNESGFNAYPAGYIYYMEDENGKGKTNYFKKGETARFWSYTTFFGEPFVRSLDSSYPDEFNRFLGALDCGFSVRCVHDF